MRLSHVCVLCLIYICYICARRCYHNLVVRPWTWDMFHRHSTAWQNDNNVCVRYDGSAFGPGRTPNYGTIPSYISSYVYYDGVCVLECVYMASVVYVGSYILYRYQLPFCTVEKARPSNSTYARLAKEEKGKQTMRPFGRETGPLYSISLFAKLRQ